VAVQHYKEELAIARHLGDVRAEADATWNLSFEHFIADDLVSARENLRAAHRLFKEVGDELSAARVEWTELTVGSGNDPSPEGLAALQALIDRFERLGDPWYLSQAEMSVAWVLYTNGDLSGASRSFIRALMLAHALRDVASTTIALPLAGLVSLLADRPSEAAMLLGASEHLSELYGVKAPLGLRQLLGEADPHGRIEEGLGSDRYAEAFDSGRQLTLDEAVALFVRVQEETWGSGDADVRRA
jgi:hypothetical protein